MREIRWYYFEGQEFKLIAKSVRKLYMRNLSKSQKIQALFFSNLL